MTREDIIRMAKEAGFEPYETLSTILPDFAALVAAAERDRIRENLNQMVWLGSDEGWDLAIEAVRKWLSEGAEDHATIRARSEK